MKVNNIQETKRIMGNYEDPPIPFVRETTNTEIKYSDCVFRKTGKGKCT